jgi:tetratricopeptide (TPR) repeat protein
VALSLPLPLLVAARSAAAAAAEARPAAAAANALAAEELVRQLGAASPQAREAASAALAQRGPGVRALLVEAVRSAASAPEVRLRAGALLLATPWDRPADPPTVRRALEGYGKKNAALRRAAVMDLARLPGGVGWDAVVRCLLEDPDDAVGWGAVTAIRQLGGPEARQALAQLDRPDVRPSAPAYVMIGRLTAARDRAKAAGLFEKAVELTAENPAAAAREIHFVFRDLLALAAIDKNYDRAASIFRRELSFADAAGRFDRPSLLFDLFAVHAEFGPLPGLRQDMLNNAGMLTRPEIVYCLGKLQERQGRRLLAAVIYGAASVASAQDPARRAVVGDRLVGQKWPELAVREYEAVLARPGAAPLDVARAHLGLANAAGQRHDHWARAEHLRHGIDLAEQYRFIVSAERSGLTGDPRKDLRVRMHWAYLKAAREKHDDAAAKAHVAEMLKLQPNSEAVTLEVVPLLKKWGDAEQARALFARSYDRARAAVAAAPDDPQALNGLAWMCALCGEELAEAERASKRAVELAPGNIAYLDTAAEVQFRLGKADEAVRLEIKALGMKPDDSVLKRQLERFKKQRPADDLPPEPDVE